MQHSVEKLEPDMIDRYWLIYLVRDGFGVYEYRSRRKLRKSELLWRHFRHMRQLAIRERER